MKITWSSVEYMTSSGTSFACFKNVNIHGLRRDIKNAVLFCFKGVGKWGQNWKDDLGTNAVLHLNHINASNISKLYIYIIWQFITWKLHWYQDTNHSLQTCIIALKNIPVNWHHVWMFLCTSSKMCINPKVRLGLGLRFGLRFGFIHIFGGFYRARKQWRGTILKL